MKRLHRIVHSSSAPSALVSASTSTPVGSIDESLNLSFSSFHVYWQPGGSLEPSPQVRPPPGPLYEPSVPTVMHHESGWKPTPRKLSHSALLTESAPWCAPYEV